VTDIVGRAVGFQCRRDVRESFLADKLATYEMPTEISPVGKLSKKELVAEEIAKTASC
jgi:hypothetical protein